MVSHLNKTYIAPLDSLWERMIFVVCRFVKKSGLCYREYLFLDGAVVVLTCVV